MAELIRGGVQYDSGEYLTLEQSISNTLTARLAELDDDDDDDDDRPPMQRRGTLGMLAERHGFDASFTTYDPDEYLEVEAVEGTGGGDMLVSTSLLSYQHELETHPVLLHSGLADSEFPSWLEGEADGKVLFSLDLLWTGRVPNASNVPTFARDAIQLVKVGRVQLHNLA
jgi:hypothetical protein